MSYTNSAGQTVEVGDRVAYAGYQGNLYIGKVVSFTPTGAPRIELEGKFDSMVRNRWREGDVRWMRAAANIWDRRPHAHRRHKEMGYLVTTEEWSKLSRDERGEYEGDRGQLSHQFVEFQVPAVHPIAKPKNAFVIAKATSAAKA